MVDTSGVVAGSTAARGPSSYVEWGAVFAGAIASLAVSLILLTFGAAVGLSAVSPWSSSATTITAVGIGSAFWILLVSLWSFALGGYLAARLRHRSGDGTEDEVDFRDNAHGMLAWAVAVTFTGFVAAMSAPSRTASVEGSWGGSAAGSSAVDTIVRSARGDIAPADAALRGVVGRTLVSNLGTGQLATEDKRYLASVVTVRSGLAQPEAETRVETAFTQFKQATDRARKAGIVMAFLTAATLMVGAATAWWAAGLGGRHRDEGTLWEVFRRGTRTVSLTKL